jgi:hypothetical protein
MFGGQAIFEDEVTFVLELLFLLFRDEGGCGNGGAHEARMIRELSVSGFSFRFP